MLTFINTYLCRR